ncbi:hypothetical protein [Nocardia sp. NPDC049707]|uniref:hypothetical protein n=1 Tax=Nocardia sp. NPDC049707 TaxID=3154735 RepID=UPI0034402552
MGGTVLVTESDYNDRTTWPVRGARTIVSLLTVVIALLTGCSHAVGGLALPEPADPATAGYRRALSSELQADMALSDRIRQVDACALINEAAIKTIGASSYFGPGQHFDECEVHYSPSIGPKHLFEVYIQVGVSDTVSPQTMVDGVPVRIRRGGDACSASVPHQLGGVTYYLMGTEGVETCDELLPFVRATLPLLKSPAPQRNNSKLSINTRLANMDPCAVLSVLSKDRPRLKVTPNMRPYWCEFLLDKDDDTTWQSWVSTQKTLEMLDGARKYNPGEVVPLTGPAVARISSTSRATSTAGSCLLDVYPDTGQTPHVRNLDKTKPERWVDVVEISTRGGCVNALKSAAVFVDLYNAR